MTKAKIENILENHEKRIKKLEKIILEKNKIPIKISNNSYTFKNKSESHNILLKKLLKSSYCHDKGGLTREEVLRIFESNTRPVVPKKIYDLLEIWRRRKRIEANKVSGKLKYFWIEDDKSKKGN